MGQPPEPPFALWRPVTDLPRDIHAVPWITEHEDVLAVGLPHGAEFWRGPGLLTWTWRPGVATDWPIRHALIGFTELLGQAWAMTAIELSTTSGRPCRLDLAGNPVDGRRFDVEADCWAAGAVLPDCHVIVAGRLVDLPVLRPTTLTEWRAGS